MLSPISIGRSIRKPMRGTRRSSLLRCISNSALGRRPSRFTTQRCQIAEDIIVYACSPNGELLRCQMPPRPTRCLPGRPHHPESWCGRRVHLEKRRFNLFCSHPLRPCRQLVFHEGLGFAVLKPEATRAARRPDASPLTLSTERSVLHLFCPVNLWIDQR